MRYKGFLKKAKRVLALALAAALLLGGWSNYDLFVRAADEFQVSLDREDAEYTGEAIELPEVTVKVTDAQDTETELTEGTDYTVAWTDSAGTSLTAGTVTDAGEYTCTVTGVEGTAYAGYSEKTEIFKVNKKTIEDDMVSLSPESAVYTGETQAPEVTVTDLTQGEDYEVQYYKDSAEGTTIEADAIKEVGDYTVQVTGTGNYTGRVTKTYQIVYGTSGSYTITPESTLTENVYPGDVTITAGEGYTIGESADECNGENLVYSQSKNTAFKVYLKEKNTGEISEIEIPAFTIDTEAPTISSSEVSESEAWAGKKTLSVSATDADICEYYYAVGTDLLAGKTTVGSSEELSKLTKIENGSVIITDNYDETGVTWYVYAIDKAGNFDTQTVTVKMIDNTAPEVVLEQNTNWDGTCYWKNGEALSLPVTVTDDASGFDEGTSKLSVSKDGGAAQEVKLSLSEDQKSLTGSVTITEAGTYTVTAKDAAGNTSAETSFTVKQDTGTPSISLWDPTVDDNETAAYKAEADGMSTWWTGTEQMNLPFTVVDTAGTGETENSGYIVEYSTKADMSGAQSVAADQAGKGILTLGTDDLTAAAAEYYFRVRDYAGNQSGIVSIKVARDMSAPVITSVAFPQDENGDNWLNEEELSENGGKVRIQVNVEDSETGIATIKYFPDVKEDTPDSDWKEADYTAEGNCYTFDTEETYTSSADYNWGVRVTNHVALSASNTDENLQIDIDAPESQAYIQFESDTKGLNSETDGTSEEEGSWISKIFDAATHTWAKIWGKKEISFEIYVQDKISGMNDGLAGVTLSYSGDGSTVTLSSEEGTLKREDGLKAFKAEGTDSVVIDESQGAVGNGSGYTVYSGSIEVADDADLAVKDFTITELVDAAGNVQSAGIALEPADSDFIFLDAVAPKLAEVSIGGNSIVSESRYFYQESVTVKMAVEERFFKDAYAPEVKVLSKTSGETDFKEIESFFTDPLQWSGSEDGQRRYTAEVILPAPETDGSETEYQIQLAFSDPSGNALEAGEGITGVEGGIFTSKTIVIDNIAPELKQYTVNPATAYAFNDAAVYTNDVSGDDLQVTFTLDDNAAYRENGELAVEIYEKGEHGEEDLLIASTDSAAGAEQTLELTESLVSGREHTYSFGFDGRTENPENEYYVKLTYKDAAGNVMESGSFAVTNGEYESDPFIIDHVAPIVNISYSAAHQVTDGGNKTVEGQTQPLSGHISYYGAKEGSITVTVEITEKYLQLTDGAAADFVLEVNGNPEAVQWTDNGDDSYTGFYTITEEGSYEIKVSYKDTAGNAAAGGQVEGGTVTDGAYTSPELVLDTTAPVVSRSYTDASVNQNGNRQYFNEAVNLNIVIEDQNIRYQELQESLAKMTASDSSGALIESSSAKTAIGGLDTFRKTEGTCTVEIPLSTEANYTIPIAYTDLAGNKAELDVVEYPTVDTTAPKDLKFDYSIEDPVNYGPFGWLFSKVKMTITASAGDETSGLQFIRFTVTDETGKETVKEGAFTPRADGSYAVEIPLESADFKGTVKAEVIDWSRNQIEQTRNHVVESGGRHSSTGSAVITTKTQPSRVVNGVNFYNTDVDFNLKLSDSYSGLRSYEYTAGHTLSGSRNYAEEAGTDLSQTPEREIVYEFSQDMRLVASRNNENDIRVLASFVDNAGHTGQVEQLYNIDITVPVITVEWDLNEPANGKYFNQTRTATVTIRERNFDEHDVEFSITNTDGAMPDISGWRSSGQGDSTTHTCTVTFNEDGDYTFTLAFQDMAGNHASYDTVDEFTIDKTLPELTVSWDNNNSQNEYYYNANRTATIDILEHNFEPELIDVIITAEGASVPSLSGWRQSGDHNIASVTFSEDGDYTFDIEGMDLAENLLEDYQMERFIVDQTVPELEIFDIENMSANNGVVMPGVRYSDLNYDPDGTVIQMTGYHNGPVEMDGTRTSIAGGMEIKLNDFEHVQEMDDMYTMEAVVYDLAGNSSEDSVVFSVNRFGSVYTFDEKTNELVGEGGKYYTNEEQELVVTETNVDTLEFREITRNLDGTLETMAEDEDYTVEESGTDVSWKQYTYTMPAENFEEEGTYILTIYSEDRASNTSDNSSKGKNIEFVVDKTKPSILVSGVENDGQYREHSRQITLDVQDNIRLAEVTVQIDGEETVFSAAEVEEADGKLTLTAGSANHWQNMSVTAYDAAGNEETSEELRFLITANILVQFFMNKPLFYGTLAVIAVLAAGGWRLWLAAKKRKKEEEQ